MTLKEKKLNALKKLWADVNVRAEKFFDNPDSELPLYYLDCRMNDFIAKLNDYERWSNEQFDKQLNKCSKTVATWPKWKQELLGGTASEKNPKN